MQPKRLILALFAILSGLCFWGRPAHDPDLGWHLNGGAWILDKLGTGASLQQALPSFDFINTFNPVWHDYHWLSQIILFKIYQFGGYAGLHLALALTACLICLTLISVLSKSIKNYSLTLALFCLLPAYYFIYDVASVRPQVISILFIALALNQLLNKPKPKEIFYLLVLSVILVNVHVYWVFIPFLWFAFRCIPRFFKRRHAPSAIYAWFGFFILSFAGLASPYGIYHSDPTLANVLMNYALIWDYLNTPKYLQKIIIEFQSPMRSVGIVPVFMLLWLVIVARFFTVKRFLAKFEIWFVGLVGFILCFKAVKFIGVFAVIGLPLAALAAKRVRLFRRINARHYLVRTSCVLLVLYLAVRAYATNPYNNNITAKLIELLPYNACLNLAKSDLTPTQGRDHVRVLTHFNYGGWCRWLVYRKNPELDVRVTTDGRTQGVPAEQFIKSFDVYYLNEDWDKTLQEWSPDAVLAAREHQLAHLLFKMPQAWRVIYQDERFAIFLPVK